MNPFTGHPETKKLIIQLKEKKLDFKEYSDILDEDGNQYVDFVQEGGGMLGIALAGYTYIMESAGIRFFSLAGTSAGAINAMLMAGIGEMGEPVAEKITNVLSTHDMSELVDGNALIRIVLPWVVKKRRGWKLLLALSFPLLSLILWKRKGVNPGKAFENWIDESLSKSGIHNMADLKKHRKKIPKLIDRVTGDVITREAGLKIIAADVTTKSKICFPEMAELYWPEPEKVKPSCYVRASMSVPFFFRPYVVENIPNAGINEDVSLPKNKTAWRKHAGYYGIIPEKVYFVDGGMLSNFPINAFHLKEGIPKKPTFGARLSTWRDEYAKTDNLFSFSGAMISSMRQLHDYDFLLRNPDYKQLICSIDADAKEDEKGNPMFPWLDFNMSDEKQVQLFLLGAKKALEFLDSFSWERYKDSRIERVKC